MIPTDRHHVDEQICVVPTRLDVGDSVVRFAAMAAVPLACEPRLNVAFTIFSDICGSQHNGGSGLRVESPLLHFAAQTFSGYSKSPKLASTDHRCSKLWAKANLPIMAQSA